jgi:ABC-type multidrug transport system fused ATPase/permease subunit
MMDNFTPVAQIDQLQLGQLRKRRNRMRMYMVFSVVIAIMSLIALIFNPQLIYRLFEISPTLQQLHIPAAAEMIRQKVGEQTDYFGHLLGWLFWLAFKPLAAFIGAFVVVIYAKRWRFFQIRMLGFGKKVLAWLISFILIWSGLAWLQAEIRDSDDIQEQSAKIIQYKQDISQSRMYFYVQRSQLAEPMNDYLLAQTALLQKPADTTTAKYYVDKLIEYENNHPTFQVQYDIDKHQLWAMQQQIYGKAVTPLAQSVQDAIPMIDKVMAYSRWLFMIATIIFGFFTVIFYGLTRQFSKRLERINTQLRKE